MVNNSQLSPRRRLSVRRITTSTSKRLSLLKTLCLVTWRSGLILFWGNCPRLRYPIRPIRERRTSNSNKRSSRYKRVNNWSFITSISRAKSDICSLWTPILIVKWHRGLKENPIIHPPNRKLVVSNGQISWQPTHSLKRRNLSGSKTLISQIALPFRSLSKWGSVSRLVSKWLSMWKTY